jgi:hypothetical protein
MCMHENLTGSIPGRSCKIPQTNKWRSPVGHFSVNNFIVVLALMPFRYFNPARLADLTDEVSQLGDHFYPRKPSARIWLFSRINVRS